MTPPPIVDTPSPNHDARPPGEPVDMMVLHYTGMKTSAEALSWLCNPASRVSAHYLIDEAGGVYRLVDEARRAWHAGVAGWRGHRDINARSIGIELANPGHDFGYANFPSVQIDALINLARDILNRHPLPARNVVGHSDVAPARKIDPGERFPWETLAIAGIGLWSNDDNIAPIAQEEVAETLARIGYALDLADLDQVLIAFQSHFRAGRVDGIADPATRDRLAAIMAMLAPDAATS